MNPTDATRDTPSTCDSASAALSALLDDELTHLDRLDAIDHLADCAACRRFYRRARDFDLSLAALEGEGVEAPVNERMWSRVAAATAESAPEAANSLDTEVALATVIAADTTHKTSARLWLSSLAAMALLASSLWLMQRLHPDGATTSGVYELQLEEDRGQMTEERFVALTTEVLRADRRYHHKMLEVMTTVADRTRFAEGTVGDTARRPESREDRRDDERFDDRTIH